MKRDDFSSADLVYAHDVPSVGRFTLRPLSPAQDLALLHQWLSSEHAAFWGMRHYTPAQVAGYFEQVAASAHVQALIGHCDDQPAFLLETYDPRRDPVSACYPAAAGDCGMHFLTAPPTRPVHGFTRAVMRTIQAWLFSDPRVSRIVVEPAIANQKIHPINLAAGFVYQRQIDLPNKRAWLAFCTREDLAAREESLS
ncbi:GNAT family N-acetyltransferase [Paludibacterium purpuratum]|uniref:RimJ/RimL family protein N-acetyltransferase n=1 Tax=Paludibacterium purpuratum TaxID=1144873 RepID=A0A4R7BCQ0_9NEIS|nr:GNAT family N-acetyltransferase [Paludibacterium purpuratum]TDR82850.1 RimJ/RimL family protein N-acetyltransferase [Paludibacterium purpuratum]